MNIHVLLPNQTITPPQKEILKALGAVTYGNAIESDEPDLVARLQDADILLTAPKAIKRLTNYFFQSLPKLRLISTMSVGYDKIDLKAASDAGVLVCNCPGANAQAVVEHTWGLVFSLSKRITEFDRDLRFHTNGQKKYEGIELRGKTLGILGTGHIGSLVAAIGKQIGMRVVGYNRHNHPTPGFDAVVTFPEIMGQSDVIVVAMPISDETKYCINAETLGLAKPHVIIVNTAREDIVEKGAIIAAVKSGHVFGYGVDAEVVDTDDPYFHFPNIIVNIHNAYNTKEAKVKTEKLAVENIRSFISGYPINRVV